MALVNGIIFLVIGLVACFLGLRFFRVVLALIGFGIGYYFVSGLLGGQSDIVMIAGGIVGGLIVGFIFYSLYQFAQILAGVVLGLIAGGLVINAFNLDGAVAIVIVLVLAIIGGLIGRALADMIIRLSTAFSGASMAIGGLAAIAAALSINLPLADPTHGGANTDSVAGIITLVATVALSIVGYFYQARHAS